MANKKLFKGTVGLKTKLEPSRLNDGAESGIVELAEAVNVYIDHSGMPRRRAGWHLETAGELHSIFCDGGDGFVIKEYTSDAAIMKVNNDLTLTGIRSGLTVDKRMGWVQVNDATFYGNGVENGYIRNATSAAWPVDTYYGPDSSEDFTTAPVGNHFSHRNGIIGIVKGKEIYFNHIPFVYGLFNLKSGFVQFNTDVVMLKAVAGGWWVSDSEFIWFLRGNTPLDFVQEKKANYPAIEWGEAIDLIELTDIGFETPGLAAVFATSKGQCIGTPDGNLINLTKDKIDIAAATTAASLVYDEHVLSVTI